MPRIGWRYWVAILLASVFGTNAGDLYAHDSGLGIGPGLFLLAFLAMAAFLAETRDRMRHEVWYWLAIVIIRTGATNIGDLLAYRLRIPGPVLAAALIAAVAILAWLGSKRTVTAQGRGLPATGPSYWTAMLAAGVFGTVVGDMCAHRFGKAQAGATLSALLLAILLAGRKRATASAAAYWTAVLTARTAGTCIGDWLAESKALQIGLPLSTLMTGTLFVTVAVLQGRGRPTAPAAA
jgi:uncharacterized membrane-anchored protein